MSPGGAGVGSQSTVGVCVREDSAWSGDSTWGGDTEGRTANMEDTCTDFFLQSCGGSAHCCLVPTSHSLLTDPENGR